MKKKPWNEPGYLFYTAELKAFCGGYEPVGHINFVRGAGTLEHSQRCREGRSKSAEAGTGWGRGTLPGLSKRQQSDVDRNDRIRRGAL